MRFCVASKFSGKKSLPPKLGKWTKNGPKESFLNLLKNLVINFYWNCSIMKIYIICCAPAQTPHFGKFLPLRYDTMFSVKQITGFFNQPYLRNKSVKFCMMMQNLGKLKLFYCFWVGVVKNGCGNYIKLMRPSNLLYFKNESMNWAYFFAYWLWYNNFWLDQCCIRYL